jgi:hypothetical protein
MRYIKTAPSSDEVESTGDEATARCGTRKPNAELSGLRPRVGCDRYIMHQIASTFFEIVEYIIQGLGSYHCTRYVLKTTQASKVPFCLRYSHAEM